MPPETPENRPDSTLTVTLRQSTIDWLEGARKAMGLRSTADLAGRLLDELAGEPGDA
jgi:hypothetical protein